MQIQTIELHPSLRAAVVNVDSQVWHAVRADQLTVALCGKTVAYQPFDVENRHICKSCARHMVDLR